MLKLHNTGTGGWRDAKIGEQGNPDAPVGSRGWAVHIAHHIRSAVKDTESDAKRLKGWIEDFREKAAYEAMEYDSWEDFCTDWLGYDPAEIRVLVTARQQAQALAEEYDGTELRDGPGRPKKDVNQHNKAPKPSSGSQDYLTARIARDHPKVHERMKAGEFRSVRQAAIEAGIIEDRKRVSFYADDPERAAKNIVKHMCREDIEALTDELMSRLEVIA